VFYKSFVQRVADGRKRKYEEMEPLAQGRVWLGAQAKQNGLVDELGGLDSAIDLIKRRANIAASEKVTLVTYPPRRTLFDLIWNRSDDASQLESALGVKARALLGRLPIRSLTEGGILRLMPYSIEVK
jgi:protease-4